MIILQPLNYEYQDLEPYIDTETMGLHHSKHLQTYVDKANTLLTEAKIEYKNDIITTYNHILNGDIDQKRPLLNQLGQVYNHNLYFENLVASNRYAAPNQDIKTLIEKDFGSAINLEQQLQEEAMKIFGSGWQWLVLNKESNKLELLATSNADFPDTTKYKHLLVIDVWEHAYYLKYQNRRMEYLSKINNVINWDIVNNRLVIN